MEAMKQVLFLCSGNYYRSRFAEHLFNWLAAKSDLPWRADSRGLRVGQYGNIGAISRYALEGLKLRGILINGEHRYPLELTLADLAASDLVIAVKEAEHRSTSDPSGENGGHLSSLYFFFHALTYSTLNVEGKSSSFGIPIHSGIVSLSKVSKSGWCQWVFSTERTSTPST